MGRSLIKSIQTIELNPQWMKITSHLVDPDYQDVMGKSETVTEISSHNKSAS